MHNSFRSWLGLIVVLAVLPHLSYGQSSDRRKAISPQSAPQSAPQPDSSSSRGPSKGPRDRRMRPHRVEDKYDEGDRAPDFKLNTLDGKHHVTLSDYRGIRPVALVFGSYT